MAWLIFYVIVPVVHKNNSSPLCSIALEEKEKKKNYYMYHRFSFAGASQYLHQLTKQNSMSSSSTQAELKSSQIPAGVVNVPVPEAL